MPCMATVATIYSETKSLKLTLLVVAYVISTALVISLVTYRIAMLCP
jgi:ferrous iron transport protein B